MDITQNAHRTLCTELVDVLQFAHWSLTYWTRGSEELCGVGETVVTGWTHSTYGHALPVSIAPRLTGKGMGGVAGAIVPQWADAPHPSEVGLGGACAARVGQGDIVRPRVGAIDARCAVVTCNAVVSGESFKFVCGICHTSL